MTRVILQPAGGPEAIEHYRRTIQSPVRLARLAPLLAAAELAELSTTFPDGLVRIWGVTPGTTNRNKKSGTDSRLTISCCSGVREASSRLVSSSVRRITDSSHLCYGVQTKKGRPGSTSISSVDSEAHASVTRRWRPGGCSLLTVRRLRRQHPGRGEKRAVDSRARLAGRLTL